MEVCSGTDCNGDELNVCYDDGSHNWCKREGGFGALRAGASDLDELPESLRA